MPDVVKGETAADNDLIKRRPAVNNRCRDRASVPLINWHTRIKENRKTAPPVPSPTELSTVNAATEKFGITDIDNIPAETEMQLNKVDKLLPRSLDENPEPRNIQNSRQKHADDNYLSGV